jgi:hypothetical protein
MRNMNGKKMKIIISAIVGFSQVLINARKELILILILVVG